MFKQILETVLPLECVACGFEGVLLCNVCLTQIVPPTDFHCPFCKTRTTAGVPCKLHREATLEAVIAAAKYQNPIIRAALHSFKYAGGDLAKMLGAILANTALRFRSLLPEKAVIVPIPLLWHREAKRGSNQSVVLGQAVSEMLGLPFEPVLRRRYTFWDLLISKHADLAHHDSARWFSLRRAFIVRTPEKIAGRDIILIDDVLTSGANLEMAARVLRRARAGRIVGLVLARA